MDVCSGAIHVVDDVTYDVIALYEEKNLEEIKKELSDTYNKEEIEEAYKVTSLKEEGLLFTEDIYEEYINEVKSKKTVVKSSCCISLVIVTLPAAVVPEEGDLRDIVSL